MIPGNPFPWTKYIPIKPTPKQLAFLSLLNLEAFYGGAAGGGKSEALLAGALQYVDVPGYAGILIRKNYADLSLPGALMHRANEWLRPTDAHWREKTKSWIFPSGATLSFGYLENPRDKYRYQSSQFQFIGFDELTQQEEADYRYLFSRLRKLKTASVPLRMRSASNPGGVGHIWVKQRFIIEGMLEGRPFIPATLDDNPYLDRESYVKSLANLDPVTRKQLLEGDWDASADRKMFKREWFEIVPAAPVGQVVRYWDLAATKAKPGKDPDWTVGCKIIKSDKGQYFIADVKRDRLTPANVEALIKQTAQLDGRSTYIYMEQEPGAAGVNNIDHYTRRILQGYAFRPVKTSGPKDLRAAPFSSQSEAGNVKLVQGPWITPFLDELESFPGGTHDDQVDAASGAMEVLMATKEPSIRWV